MARIADIGYYLPDGAGRYTTHMAYRAMEKIKKPFENADFVILCTQTPESPLPAASHIIQEITEISQNCLCFDFNQSCAGYVVGLSVASALIDSGQARSGLLLTSEAYSKWIHPDDKACRDIFADGASATWLKAGEGIGPFVHGSDGRGYEHFTVKNGYLHMNGPEIFRFTMERVPELWNQLLRKSSLSISDIDKVILHQASPVILKSLYRKLQIPSEKAIVDFEETKNTVSSTIPIAIARAVERGDIKDRDVLALLGFGAGYSWSGCIVDWRAQ